MARQARWFLEIFLDETTARWWSGTGPAVFDGQTYTGLGARWKTPEALQRTDSLKSETIDLEFDSSRQTVNADPIGWLLDQRWRRRAIRLRQVAWEFGDVPDNGTVLDDERGRIRNLSDEIKAGSPATLTMEIESGVLAYLERRMELRTPASQKRVFPEDLGFDLIAKLEGKTILWRTNYKKTKPLSVRLQDEYEPQPRQLALGRFVTSGSFVAAFANRANTIYLNRVIAIADHRINQLDRLWVNGDLVRSAPLAHGVRTLIRLPNDKGEDRCWITFYDGRHNQAGDAFLSANSPEWTANHRLRGVAYAIIEHRWDSDLAEDFDYRFGGEGARLYDRRKDSTRGGTGAHRWDDPDSWEYSTNAMVATDHYRSGIRIMPGSSAMWFGVGEAVDAVPYAEFAALADHCDDLVPLKNGGVQRRYEVNGVLSADKSHDKNLELLAAQMAARPIAQSGRLAIRPPVVRTPVITIRDGDLVRGTPSRIDPGAGIDDMVNTLEGRFINPDNDYKKDDIPKVSIDAYVDADGGEILDTRDLDLEINAERGQRVLKLVIEDSRCILEMEETYRLPGRVIEPGEWFVRESDLRGFPDGKMFIAKKCKKFANGSIRVTSREVYPDQLVWVAETARDVTVPPDVPPSELAALPPPVITAAPVALVAGDATLPAVRLTHAAYAEFIGDEIICELGFSNGLSGSALAISGASQFAKIPGNVLTVDAFVGLPPSTAFAIRFRARQGERYSAWSPYQEFYSTSLYRVGDISTVGGRAAAEVLSGIDTNAESLAREILMRGAWNAAVQPLLWIGGQTVGAVAVAAREVAEDSAVDISLLGVRNGAGTAFILSADTVTVPSSGEPGSSAISLTTLRSQHDASRADITVLYESVAGSLARLQLTTDVNGHINGMVIYNDGVPATSGVYFLTTNFAIVDPGNALTAPFYPFAVTGGIVRMDEVWVRRVQANSITTDSLVDNSVSSAEIIFQYGPHTLSASATNEVASPPDGTGFSTVLDDDIVHEGGRLKLHVSFANFLNGGTYCAVFAQVLIDGVVMDGRYHLLHPLFGCIQEWTFAFTDVPAGTRNLQIRIRANRASSGAGGTSPNTVSVEWCRVIKEELKK